jgi:hypothetical protein
MRLESSVVVLATGVIWLVAAKPALGEERSSAASDANQATGSDSDAALGGLFRSARVTVDPAVAQLEALMVELEARPSSKTAGKIGLDRARVELSRLRRLIDRRADEATIARKKQLVWAALSSSDRQMARAELAAALQTALSRRQAAEAQLKAAQIVRDAQRSELQSQKSAQPSEHAEPAK